MQDMTGVCGPTTLAREGGPRASHAQHVTEFRPTQHLTSQHRPPAGDKERRENKRNSKKKDVKQEP
jgi:hypothetical protein